MPMQDVYKGDGGTALRDVYEPPTKTESSAPPKDPLITEIEEAQAGRKKAAEKVTDAEQEIIRRQQETLKPAVEHLTTEAKKPGVGPPKELLDYKEEPPPSVSLRPFLDADTKNSIQAVVAGIGTLITTAIGGRAPIAALHAFNGAMNGWAEGDMERANRSFQDYQARVGKLHRETAMALKRAEWARQLSMDDLERAKVWTQASLMDLGMDEKVAELQGLDLNRWLQRETTAYAVYDRAVKQYNDRIKLGIDEANSRARQKQADAAMVRALAYKDWARTGSAVAGRRAKIAGDLSKVDQQRNGLKQRGEQIEQIDKAVTLLDKAGVIPRSGTKQEILAASIKLNYLMMNRPDVAEAVQVIRRWGTSRLVGQEIENQMGKVAAMRFAKLAEAEAGGILEIPKPFWDTTLKQMRDYYHKNLSVLDTQHRELSQILHDLRPEETGQLPASLQDILRDAGVPVED
jgi:hypothetical protein